MAPIETNDDGASFDNPFMADETAPAGRPAGESMSNALITSGSVCLRLLKGLNPRTDDNGSPANQKSTIWPTIYLANLKENKIQREFKQK